MKKFKKLLAVLLSLAMALGMLHVTTREVQAVTGTAITDCAGFQSAVKNGGTYYLANDIVVDSSYSSKAPAAALTIDMNGYNISTNGYGGRFCNAPAFTGRTVTIKNSSETGGKISGFATDAGVIMFYVQCAPLVISENVTIENCGNSTNHLIYLNGYKTYASKVTLSGKIQNCTGTSMIATNPSCTGAGQAIIKSGAVLKDNTTSHGDIYLQSASTQTGTCTANVSAGTVGSITTSASTQATVKISGGYVGSVTFGEGAVNSITSGWFANQVTPADGYTCVTPITVSNNSYPYRVVADGATFTVNYYDGAEEYTDLANTSALCVGETVAAAQEKEDVVFDCWNTSSDGSGVKVDAETIIQANKDQAVKLYAQWVGTSMVAVHYYDGETEYSDISTSVNAGSGITLAAAQEKAGCVMTGWNTAADGSGETLIPGANYTMGDTELNLYAMWAASEDTVATVTPEGGNISYFTDITEAFNAAIEASTDSTGTDLGTTGTNVTIKLLKDSKIARIALRKGSSLSYDRVVRTFTIDLNGCMLTGDKTQAAFTVNYGTTVKFVDSTATAENPAGDGFFIAGIPFNGNAGSKYIIEAGNFYGLQSLASDTPTTTIKAGKFNLSPAAKLASGYSVLGINEKYNDRYPLKYEVVSGAAVATVDGIPYASAASAVEAAGTDGTVVFTGEPIDDTIVVNNAEADITFDFGGQTLSVADEKPFLNIFAGNVTITNGTLATGARLSDEGYINVKAGAGLTNVDVIFDQSADTGAIAIYSTSIVTDGNGNIINDGDVYQAEPYVLVFGASLDITVDLDMQYLLLVVPTEEDNEAALSIETDAGIPGAPVTLAGGDIYGLTVKLNAAEMGNTISADFKIGDTVVYEGFEYSVVEYAQTLNKLYADDDALNTLLANQLRFGSTVEKYWEESDGTAFDLPEVFESYLTNELPTATNKAVVTPSTNANLKIKSASLNVDEKVSLVFNVYAPAEKEGTLNNFTLTVAGVDYEYTSDRCVYMGNGVYRFQTEELTPVDFDTVYTATLKNAKGEVVHAITYSANSYCFTYKANETVAGQTTMAELAKAIYNYGIAADRYKGEPTYEEPKYEWNDTLTECTATIEYADPNKEPIIETVEAVRTITQEKTTQLPEICTYTAEFENEKFETQVLSDVRTKAVAIEFDSDAVYLPTVELASQVYYRIVYTGGGVGSWKLISENDISGDEFIEEDELTGYELVVSMLAGNLETEEGLWLPLHDITTTAEAADSDPYFKTSLVQGVVAQLSATDARQDVILYDKATGKTFDIIFYSTPDVINNFVAGDEVRLPVIINGNGKGVYMGEEVWENYIVSTGNDVTGFEAVTLPALVSIELASEPAVTNYTYEAAPEELKLSGGVIYLNFDDGSQISKEITADMLERKADDDIGELTYTITYEGMSTDLELTYDVVSVDEFAELGANDTKHVLRAIVVCYATTYTSLQDDYAELIVKDLESGSMTAITGLGADGILSYEVGDEILATVTKTQYSYSYGNANKTNAAVAKDGTTPIIQTLSTGNDAALDKENAIYVSDQEGLDALVSTLAGRSSSAYQLIHFAAGLRFANYSTSSNSLYLTYSGTSYSTAKSGSLNPYFVGDNQTNNLGGLMTDLYFDGTKKVFSKYNVLDKDCYMIFVGGIGAYYSHFLIPGTDYVDTESVAFDHYDFTAPAKTKYIVGDKFSFDGVSLYKRYTSPVYDEEVTLTTDNITDMGGFDANVAGTYTITVTADEQTFTFDIEVIDAQVSSIIVKSAPTTTVYDQRTTLDDVNLAGGVITAEFEGGATADFVMDRTMLPEDSTMAFGEQEYTVTFGGAETTLTLTKEIQALSVSEFLDLPESDTYYDVNAIVVGPANASAAIELLLMDKDTDEILAVIDSGIAGTTSAPALNETYCKAGDEIVVSLCRKNYASAGNVNGTKPYGKGDKVKSTIMVVSSGNQAYPEITEDTAVTPISTQEELQEFLLNNDDRFYSIVQLYNVKGVTYSTTNLRIFFGDDVTSYQEQQIHYKSSDYCSPYLAGNNMTTYLGSDWQTEYFNDGTSTSYTSPATSKYTSIYALCIGGNSYYNHFVVLDESWINNDELRESLPSYVLAAKDDTPVVNTEKVVPEKHLILTPDGNYGGTTNLSKYGEGTPLNGENDHTDSIWYEFGDYYNAKCTDSRTILTGFAPYQQTMADSDGIACALMALNYYGEDVTSENGYNEENLVMLYELLNDTTIYGEGCTASGLVELFDCLGYEAESTTYSSSASWIKENLEQGNIIMFRFHDDEKTVWHAVIGVDTMGSSSTGDDVIITANPFDVGDHYQDGYTKNRASSTGTWAKEMHWSGVSSREKECVVVHPNSAITLQYESDGDDTLLTNPSHGERHLLLNGDGTFGGPYKKSTYGGGAACNGYYLDDNSTYRDRAENLEHFEYGYYAFPDIYNLTDGDGLTILENFSTFQQTMASSCGISSTLNTLNYLGFDFDELLAAIDDSKFADNASFKETFDKTAHEQVQEAIVRIYTQTDDYFDTHGLSGFNNYGGVGAGNLSQVPLALGYDNTVIGRFYRTAYTDKGQTREETMCFPTYESFVEFVTTNIDAGQPIIFCGPNHWRVIIGFDTMNNDDPYDDVIILADSSDKWDHFENGWDTERGTQFYAHWYNGSASTNQQYVLIKGY